MTIIDILEKAITHLERSGSTQEERFSAADGLRGLIGKPEAKTDYYAPDSCAQLIPIPVPRVWAKVEEPTDCTDPDRKNCPQHCVVFCNKKTEAEDEPRSYKLRPKKEEEKQPTFGYRHICTICNGRGFLPALRVGNPSIECRFCSGSGWSSPIEARPMPVNYAEMRKTILWKAIGAIKYHGSLEAANDYQRGYIYGRQAAVDSLRELMVAGPSAEEQG